MEKVQISVFLKKELRELKRVKAMLLLEQWCLLCPVTECLNIKMQMKNGVKAVESFSLEDLMFFTKEILFEAAESEVKRERRRSATSTSCSHQVNCRVSNLFPKSIVNG